MLPENSAKESSRTCVITMVHGTWGRGFFPREHETRSRSWWDELFPTTPPWFGEGSDFRKNLESALRKENIAATFRIFQWTGANSVFHRARAANQLGGLLASDRDDINSIVIAHSHGGNVALRAISRLGSRGARIGLVTLATPFLGVFPTWEGPRFWEVTIYIYFLLIYSMVSLLLPAMPRSFIVGYDDWVKTGILLAMFVFPAAAAALLVRLIINPGRPSDRKGSDRQTNRWAWRPFIIADSANYESAGPHAPNLLVIRGVDDEAALVLAFGAIATRINRLLLGATWKTIYPVLVLLYAGSVLTRYTEWFDLDPDVFLQLRVHLWLILVSVTAILLLLPALLNSRFGREFLIGAFRCEIAADSAPDYLTRARLITLETPYQPLPFGGLSLRIRSNGSSTSSIRHKLYNYPSCVPEIV